MTLFCKTFRKVSLGQVVGLQYFRAFIRGQNDTMTLFLRKNHIQHRGNAYNTRLYIYKSTDSKGIDKTTEVLLICVCDVGRKDIGYAKRIRKAE